MLHIVCHVKYPFINISSLSLYSWHKIIRQNEFIFEYIVTYKHLHNPNAIPQYELSNDTFVSLFEGTNSILFQLHNYMSFYSSDTIINFRTRCRFIYHTRIWLWFVQIKRDISFSFPALFLFPEIILSSPSFFLYTIKINITLL